MASPGSFVPVVALPRRWPRTVKAGVVQAMGLAHLTITCVRGWCANSLLERVRLAGENERLTTEVAWLHEELRIKNARLAAIPARNRPHYPPPERLAILQLRAARGWTQAQTAARFLLADGTVASWMDRLDEEGPKALVQLLTPVNRFPDFVRHIVTSLKTTCPILGVQRIANLLARAGLHLGRTTVRRFLRRPTPLPAPVPSPAATGATSLRISPRTVKSRAPNHAWNIDLTVVPAAGGLWCPWLPQALVQRWPFCWWTVVVLDHFSRKMIAAGLFGKQPTALEVCALLDRAVRKAGRAPKYTITDQGAQFQDDYRDWCSWHGVKPRFGAVGRYGSIAVIERFMRTLKQECCRRILVPYGRDAMARELTSFTTWYNEFRPHEGLHGATPDEIYRGVQQAHVGPRFETRRKYPTRKRKLRARKGTRLVLVLAHLDGKGHLPIVDLGAA
jgi:transposase InsO family protein